LVMSSVASRRTITDTEALDLQPNELTGNEVKHPSLGHL
jgi:hypothetical protein